MISKSEETIKIYYDKFIYTLSSQEYKLTIKEFLETKLKNTYITNTKKFIIFEICLGKNPHCRLVFIQII